ncbi:hypothetical protein [Brachybacterium vulturis]|uniref:hypothetical protein n=1 Tax=Brachybacterium vulturis TaxID=2017484 RepID=UPI003736E562
MKTLRTYGIIVAVALAAIGLALLPSAEEAPQARPGITVGGTAPADPASRDAGAAPSAEGAAVALPTASGPSAHGSGTDAGLGTMETGPSPSPAPAPQRPRASRDSSDSSSSAGDEGARGRPSGVCEWDDGELQCEDDHDHDDDEDGDEEDDDG